MSNRDRTGNRRSKPMAGVDCSRGSDANSQSQDDLNELMQEFLKLEERYSHIGISGSGDVAGGVIVQDKQCFVWGVCRGDIFRPVTIKLLIDGIEIFSCITSAFQSELLYATGYYLEPHRRMMLRVDNVSVEGKAIGEQMFWVDEQSRRDLRNFVLGVREDVHEARMHDLIWANIPKLGRRLDPPVEISAHWRAPAYTDYLAKAFGSQRQLTDRQAVASWIVAELLEDASKRQRFCLTEDILCFLNESLMNKSVTDYDITLAMFAFWRRHYSHIDIFTADGLKQVQYKFATAPFIAEKNNCQLITPSLRQALSAPAAPYRNRDLPWSWYWHFLLKDRELDVRVGDESFARSTSFKEVVLDIMHPERKSYSPALWPAFWSAAGSAEFTRFDLALISIFFDTPYPEMAISEHGSAYWRNWLQREVYDRAPELSVLSAMGRAKLPLRVETPQLPRQDLVIIGYGGHSGLGRNMKMFVDALSGFEPLVFSADDGSCLNPGKNYNPRVGVRARVVLLCVNADRAPEVMARFSGMCEDAHIIGFYLWESDRPPASHALGALAVDEIWCPTNYVADAYRKISSAPVTVIKKGLGLPLPHVPLLDRFRNDVSEFIFLAAAEFGSSIARKNPLDVVKAFQSAFMTADVPVRLILKIRDVNPGHWSNINSYWEELEARIIDDDRITVLEGNLVPEEYWTLLWTVDAFVSLHRSEGFGYVIADAMLAEKAVIVSDYSGSQDFCDSRNAFLVPVTEVVAPPEYLATTGYIGHWGMPDIEAAARAMAQAVADPELRSSRASVGPDRVTELYDFNRWSASISEHINRCIEKNRHVV